MEPLRTVFVYLWQIHFDIWQNQYNIVKFKNKIKLKLQKNKNKIKKLHPRVIITNVNCWLFLNLSST